ncbi:MAG: hypothetical protein IPJ07_23030 [Acidobacteria bacterium]|nr:hypothetical protein [Acidobacteriota bacterium]
MLGADCGSADFVRNFPDITRRTTKINRNADTCGIGPKSADEQKKVKTLIILYYIYSFNFISEKLQILWKAGTFYSCCPGKSTIIIDFPGNKKKKMPHVTGGWREGGGAGCRFRAA